MYDHGGDGLFQNTTQAQRSAASSTTAAITAARSHWTTGTNRTSSSNHTSTGHRTNSTVRGAASTVSNGPQRETYRASFRSPQTALEFLVAAGVDVTDQISRGNVLFRDSGLVFGSSRSLSELVAIAERAVGDRSIAQTLTHAASNEEAVANQLEGEGGGGDTGRAADAGASHAGCRAGLCRRTHEAYSGSDSVAYCYRIQGVKVKVTESSFEEYGKLGRINT